MMGAGSEHGSQLPKPDADGFYMIDGEKWGPIGVIAQYIDVPYSTVYTFHRAGCRSRPGRPRKSGAVTLYSLLDVIESCITPHPNNKRRKTRS